MLLMPWLIDGAALFTHGFAHADTAYVLAKNMIATNIKIKRFISFIINTFVAKVTLVTDCRLLTLDFFVSGCYKAPSFIY